MQAQSVSACVLLGVTAQHAYKIPTDSLQIKDLQQSLRETREWGTTLT